MLSIPTQKWPVQRYRFPNPRNRLFWKPIDYNMSTEMERIEPLRYRDCDENKLKPNAMNAEWKSALLW